eukprot:8050317-Pyramimonas_sp.AAC.1
MAYSGTQKRCGGSPGASEVTSPFSWGSSTASSGTSSALEYTPCEGGHIWRVRLYLLGCSCKLFPQQRIRAPYGGARTLGMRLVDCPATTRAASRRLARASKSSTSLAVTVPFSSFGATIHLVIRDVFSNVPRRALRRSAEVHSGSTRSLNTASADPHNVR